MSIPLHRQMLIWLKPLTLHQTNNGMHRHDLSNSAEGMSKIGAQGRSVFFETRPTVVL